MRAIKALFACCKPRETEKENEDIEKTGDESPKKEKKSETTIETLENYKINLFTKDTGITTIDENSKTNKETDTDFNKILFEDRLIRTDEKTLITFTKNGLIEFFNNLCNLEDYELLYNQNKLILHCCKKGTILTKDLYMAKGVYTIPRKDLKEGITIENIANFMYNPDERIKWDTSMKVLKKLEGTGDAYVIRSWMFSPMMMVAEREVVDKRVEIFKDGEYFNISTSAPENYLPEELGVVRVKTFFNALKIVADEENFYITSLSQMPLPQGVLNITLPTKLISWYKNFIVSINK